MIDGIQATAGARVRPLPTAPPRAEQTRAEQKAQAETTAQLPPAPPPEVLEALNTAADVIAQLEAQRLQLHFSVDENQKLKIEMVDGEGRVVREIPPKKVAALLGGAGGVLGFDARG